MRWQSKCGRIQLNITKGEAAHATTPESVEKLMQKPHIRKQLDSLKMKDVHTISNMLGGSVLTHNSSLFSIVTYVCGHIREMVTKQGERRET